MKKRIQRIMWLFLIFELIGFTTIVYYKNYKKNNVVNNINSDLAIMIQKEDGEYEKYNQDEWPTENYVFSTSLSKCEGNSELKWDKNTNIVSLKGAKNDSCKLYFSLRPCNNDEDVKTCLLRRDRGLNSLILHDNQKDYDNEENYILEANDESYRYTGKEPNNYICLDSGLTTDGKCHDDSYLYRIIGLFKNNQDQYEMKLIKYSLGTINELGSNGAYNNGNFYFFANNKYGESSANMWKDSNLNTENLNNYYLNNYLNSLYQENGQSKLIDQIQNHIWVTGGLNWSSSYNAHDIYIIMN